MIWNIHLNQYCLPTEKQDYISDMNSSPDLNPIENLLQELKVWINCQSPKSLKELEHVAIEEWMKMTEKICSRLIKNLRKWLQQVIKKKSHATDLLMVMAEL